MIKHAFPWILILSLTTFCVRNGTTEIDWLIDGSSFKSDIIEQNGAVTISNGLISRTFSLAPDGATTSFSNLMTGNIIERFEWKKRAEWMTQNMPWPPPGKRIDFTYSSKETSPLTYGISVLRTDG